MYLFLCHDFDAPSLCDTNAVGMSDEDALDEVILLLRASDSSIRRIACENIINSYRNIYVIQRYFSFHVLQAVC